MIEFWVVAAILLLIGLLIVILPLWRTRDTQESDVDQQNIDIARQKLSELKAQLANGRIEQAQYDLQINELELALNDDLSLTQSPSSSHKQGRWVIGLLVVIMPIVAVSLYLELGDTSVNGLKMPKDSQQVVAAAQTPAKPKIGSVDEMVSGLVERLKSQPDDLQGWVMLGKAYKYMNQFSKSVDAFAKANVLASNDPEVMVHYADALAMANQGRFTGESKQLILKALELDPDNITGLWLAGMLKAEEGEYVSAMDYLQTLKPLVEVGSSSEQELKTLMLNIQAKIDAGVEGAVVSQARNNNETRGEGNINALVQSLKDNPDNLSAWAELGQSYKRVKQYDKAISAFEKAKLMSGNQASSMLMYADVLIMSHEGQYSDQSKALIFKALELMPNDTTALWLAGKAKMHEGRYMQALKYLRSAQTRLQSGSQSHKVMQDTIKYAESQVSLSSIESLSVPASTAEPESKKTQTVAAEVGIQVKVELSAKMQSQTTVDDTLFIYAKALSGPQMPLAIVRKKVSDLPLIVRLTDAQAMMPMMKLSKFKQVKLTARISKTGNAIPEKGDIIGIVENVSVSSQELIRINIDSFVE